MFEAFFLCALLSFFLILLPALKAQKLRNESEFKEALEVFKLIWVRRYYQDVIEKPINFHDLSQNYDVENAYDGIRYYK